MQITQIHTKLCVRAKGTLHINLRTEGRSVMWKKDEAEAKQQYFFFVGFIIDWLAYRRSLSLLQRLWLPWLNSRFFRKLLLSAVRVFNSNPKANKMNTMYIHAGIHHMTAMRAFRQSLSRRV